MKKLSFLLLLLSACVRMEEPVSNDRPVANVARLVPVGEITDDLGNFDFLPGAGEVAEMLVRIIPHLNPNSIAIEEFSGTYHLTAVADGCLLDVALEVIGNQIVYDPEALLYQCVKAGCANCKDIVRDQHGTPIRCDCEGVPSSDHKCNMKIT